MRRYDNDKRVDFSRIANHDKVVYVHPNGFFISVEQMSEDQLEQYIKIPYVKLSLLIILFFNNNMFTLLGMIIEKTTGKTFEEVLKEEFLSSPTKRQNKKFTQFPLLTFYY